MSVVSPNIRIGCLGSSSIHPDIFWGGCGNRAEQPTKSLYQNVTKYPELTSSGGFVDPYARPAESQPNCSLYYGYSCGDGNNEQLFCGIPTMSQVNVGSSSFEISSGVYTNGFNLNGTSSIVTCSTSQEIVGFKNVYAKRFWNGRYAYGSSVEAYNVPDNFDWCGVCGGKRSYNIASSNDTKYLKVEGGGNCTIIELKLLSGVVTYTTESASAYKQTTIDEYGEIVSFTCTSASTATTASLWEPVDAAVAMAGIADGGTIEGYYFDAVADELASLGNPPYSIAGSPYPALWEIKISNSAGTEAAIIHYEPDYTSRIVYGLIYPVDATSSISWGLIFQEEYATYGTTITRDTYELNSAYSNQLYTLSHGSGSVSNENPKSNITADIVRLLSCSYWDLGDDDVYPWRTDTDVTLGPCMTRAEKFNTPQLLCDYTASGFYDGSIKGAPMPVGYDRYWNPDHPNYKICSDGLCTIKYIQSYGAWSTECNVASATNWVDQNEKSQLPQGAFFGGNFFYSTPASCGPESEVVYADQIIWGCKYAEIIQTKPSFNFARPCGTDRLQIVTGSERCISSSFSSSISLEPTGSSGSMATNDFALVLGLGSYSGVWKVTRNSDYEYVLSEQFASASAWSGWPNYTVDGAYFGKLLYSNDSTKALCGQINITNITGSPLTCSCDSPVYFLKNDTIQIVQSGSTTLSGTYTILDQPSSDTIVLSCSVTQSSSSGLIIKSSGAVDYQWADESPKGDYTVKKYYTNYRDIGERDRLIAASSSLYGSMACDGVTPCAFSTPFSEPRPYQNACGLNQIVTTVSCYQSCSGYSACAPGVAYFSPASESKLHQKYRAVNHGFSYPTPDNIYGFLWVGMINQYDNDYLWQAPPAPCQPGCQWTMDNGGCQADDLFSFPCIQYYPNVNQYEARCSIPTGSPSTVSSKVGCASVSSFTSGACPANVCDIPLNQGHFSYDNYFSITPYRPYWDIYLNKQSCVCGAGRFADSYAGQWINCQEEPI